MSKIKYGGLDQYGKYKALTGSAVKGLTSLDYTSNVLTTEQKLLYRQTNSSIGNLIHIKLAQLMETFLRNT